MKKTLATLLATLLCVSLFSGCSVIRPDAIASATSDKNAKIIRPLPEILDVNDLNDCTVAASVDWIALAADGTAEMDVTVYAYDLYDLVDIAELKEGDVIVRGGEEVKIDALERLDTGLVRINGGEENRGFDLMTDDSTVYYEIGMDNAKVYRALGKVSPPVAETFVYVDESNGAVECSFEDLANLTEYDFAPENTSIVMEDGAVIRLTKHFVP